MKLKNFFLTAALMTLAAFSKAQDAASIIPKPEQLSLQKGYFELPQKLRIKLPGNIVSDSTINAFVQQNRDRFELNSLSNKPHVLLAMTDRPAFAKEAYLLQIKTGQIIIEASHNSGLFYGLQTLSQLVNLKSGISKLRCMTITDKPKFGWRGVMLDCSRHFFTKSEVKTLIDNISRYKINTFHWHLVDDQGWRIEIKKYPQLTQKGSQGKFYTQEDIKEVVQYATDRGITVIPEIEMPGHSGAVLGVMRNLRCNSDKYQNIYCAGNDDSFTFLGDVLEETFALFPAEFVHIGGDEAWKDSWKKCPKCQKRMKDNDLENTHELQSWFIRQFEPLFAKHNKRLLGWDEILEGGLAKSATVMSWRGTRGGIEAANHGNDVIMTPNTHIYFDMVQDENRMMEPAGWDRITTLKKVYEYDPIPADLSKDKQKHILGAQANLWSERVATFDHVQYMIFPRLLPLAETLWSYSNKEKDYTRFMKRLTPHLDYLKKNDVNIRYPDGIFTEHTVNGFEMVPEIPQLKIRYTVDGTTPSLQSPIYQKSLKTKLPRLIKAAVVQHDGKLGRTRTFIDRPAFDSKDWKVVAYTKQGNGRPENVFKGWGGSWSTWNVSGPLPHFITVDLGEEKMIGGFVYTPRSDNSTKGNILEYECEIGVNRENLNVVSTGRFTGKREKQFVIFKKPVKGRFLKLKSLKTTNGETIVANLLLF